METVSRTTNERGNVAFRTSKNEIVNQGERVIKSGVEYNHLINTSDVKFTSTFTEGTVDDTVSIMCEIIRNHHGQVKELANFLKKDSEIATKRAIWNFVFNHIQYKRDSPTVEQLSTPARIWLNRSIPNTPTDCDDHSIFVGSLLYCLGIPFCIRIAGYGGKGYSHVYVVAGSVCIDTVLHKFNCEAEYTSKKDTKMMKIETLAGHDTGAVNGLDALQSLHDSGELYDAEMEQIERSEQINGVGDNELFDAEKTLRRMSKTQLETTLREYILEPEKYHALGFGKKYWEYMQKAYDALCQNESLEGIVIKLSDGADWERANLSPLNGYNTASGETIGLLGALEGFFKKLVKKVKNVAKGAVKIAGKAVKAIGSVFKKVGLFLQKINPINIAIRAVLRGMIKNNKKGLAIKMGYGLLTEAQAKSLGVNLEEWKEARKAYVKFAKKYKFLGGKESKLREVLHDGWQKAAKKSNLPTVNLLGGLGLFGRRKRKKRAKARAKKAKQAGRTVIKPKSFKEMIALKAKMKAGQAPVKEEPKMSAEEKERIDFLKLVHADEAKEAGLGVVATGTAVILGKVALILAPILKILKKLGLGKVITKLKEKHIENLSAKITNELDPVAKQKLIDRKQKAENNLAIFNSVAKKPALPPSNPELPSPRNITESQVLPDGSYPYNPEMTNTSPMMAQKPQQAGFGTIGIVMMALVGGGLLLANSGKKEKAKK
ncbi:hypothetical protein [Labilibaculum antarcticum]|nr:hypothetical protein [Labilibaculum antarcticum]